MDVNFDNASVIHSNLGGLGGQSGLVHDGQPSTSFAPTILIGDVAYDPVTRTRVNLEISNLTQYAAFGITNNGVKAKDNGSFGVVNLLGPNTDRTYNNVALRFSFLNAETGAPYPIHRTFITFYDLDDSVSGLSECLQMRESDGAAPVLTDDTELIAVNASAYSSEALLDESLPLFCSSSIGAGARSIVCEGRAAPPPPLRRAASTRHTRPPRSARMGHAPHMHTS